MKNFLKKNWTLLLVILYIISPDLILGPFDDAALLLVERAITTFINKKKSRKNEEPDIKEKT